MGRAKEGHWRKYSHPGQSSLAQNIGVAEKKTLKSTPPTESTEKSLKKSKPLPTPKITRTNEKKVFTDSPSEISNDENYDPPPLFGTGEIKLNQY